MTPALSVFHQSLSLVSMIVRTSPSTKGSSSSDWPSYVKEALAWTAGVC